MIAHIRPPNQPQSLPPIIRARHMVAETLLTDAQKRRRGPLLRKIVFYGLLAALAAAAGAAYFLLR